MVLDCINGFSTMKDDERKEIKQYFSKEYPSNQTYTTVYYDAWINDNHEDPILSLVYATIQSGQSTYDTKKKRSIGKTVGSIATAISGKNLTEVFNQVEGEDIFAALKEEKDIQVLIKEFLDGLICEHGDRLIFFIDELDRCKPDYAVRLLERIKHYFDDDRVTFVFSVDLAQLQCTVKKYYGKNFNATKYLDKFFDLHIDLPTVNIDEYLQYKLQFFGHHYYYDITCATVIKYFHFSLRETERFIRLAKISAYNYTHSRSQQRNSEDAFNFSMAFIVPVLIGLKMADMEAYTDFVHGKNPSMMLDILRPCERCMKSWKVENLSFDEFIIQVYNALFGNKIDTDNPEIYIGYMIFNMNVKQEIERVAGLLSSLCDYEFE